MTTKPAEATHVLLWSQTQSALHVEPVESMLKCNRRAYVENACSDWVPIHLGSEDECRTASTLAMNTLSQRPAGATHPQ